MFVIFLPFFVTKSRVIRLVTVEYCVTRTASNLARLIHQVIKIYCMAGFVIQTIFVDGELEKLKDKIHNAVINTTTANKHVREIKCTIHSIKERGSGTINGLLFKALPKLMVAHLLHFVVMWMYALPVTSVVSKT